MRRSRRIKRIFHSIFTKLLVISILAGFGISLLIVGFFVAYRHLAGEAFEENMAIYANYLINDIGTPPDLDRGRGISEKTGLAISYEGPDASWSTMGASKRINEANLHLWHEGRGFKAGTFHGRYVMIVNRGEGRFIFEGTGRFADERRVKRLAIMFFAVLAVLLALAYLAIRWILRPVRWLQQGVQQVGAGNLDHRVPLKRSDEFRDLSESFNTMTRRVQDLLHAKERLLLDVSHELRSPITRMKVALEFIDEGRIKESIGQDIEELEQMVSDILETYRRFKEPGVLNLKTIDLVALIEEVASLFKGRPPGVDLGNISGHLKLQVDPEKIKTVLKNVIANGLEYCEDDADPMTLSLKQQYGSAVIDIKDYGHGIPKEALPYVFEPFYRADASRSRKTGGYGLGLSLSKAITEAHGGRIEIQSEVGRGTTVRLYIPMIQNGV